MSPRHSASQLSSPTSHLTDDNGGMAWLILTLGDVCSPPPRLAAVLGIRLGRMQGNVTPVLSNVFNLTTSSPRAKLMGRPDDYPRIKNTDSLMLNTASRKPEKPHERRLSRHDACPSPLKRIRPGSEECLSEVWEMGEQAMPNKLQHKQESAITRYEGQQARQTDNSSTQYKQLQVKATTLDLQIQWTGKDTPRSKINAFGELRDATSTSRLHEKSYMGLPGLFTAEAEDNTASRRVVRASASSNQHHCHRMTTTTGYSVLLRDNSTRYQPLMDNLSPARP
ncbi:hypothetical protein BDP55DRAFT_712585 [Colletotrichum godetiae]|uniref:Uncharacterized protein n=1 Tax=Colletotrichum godetiae TaxID=1209918 RepID=A0AAJ0ATE9_9PEZI|nr:uncharacterized protein BDP55DRAFT_712585 [Colletotrichum godetiae]KAK1689468.1 hypothetical protein BDP55DRAFT_712585 [Colletotrichum godetiae]